MCVCPLASNTRYANKATLQHRAIFGTFAKTKRGRQDDEDVVSAGAIATEPDQAGPGTIADDSADISGERFIAIADSLCKWSSQLLAHFPDDGSVLESHVRWLQK